MASHSSILAWKIPWTEELVGYNPGGHKELDMTEHTLNSIPFLICHKFFIHLSVGGDLGCFYNLTIVNNAVMITGMCMYI